MGPNQVKECQLLIEGGGTWHNISLWLGQWSWSTWRMGDRPDQISMAQRWGSKQWFISQTCHRETSPQHNLAYHQWEGPTTINIENTYY